MGNPDGPPVAPTEEQREAAREEARRVERERLERVRKRLGDNLVKKGYKPPDADFVRKYEEERPDFEVWDYSNIAEGLVICTCQPSLEKFAAAMKEPTPEGKSIALAEAAIVYPERRILDAVLLAKPGLLWMIGNFVLASSGFLGGGKRMTPEEYLSKS